MKTFITKTSLLAVAAAAVLSAGVPAIASAQEFTRPADDGAAYAAPSRSHAQGEYLAYFSRGGAGQTATGGPAGGPNQGG